MTSKQNTKKSFKETLLTVKLFIAAKQLRTLYENGFLMSDTANQISDAVSC
jgi:SOS response regulatory protein OraA/RecX